MKYCYKCGKTKEKEEFYKNKSKRDGLATECKCCDKKRKQTTSYKFKKAKTDKKYSLSLNGKKIKNKACKKWQQKNRFKYNAQIIHNYYLKINNIKKPCNCSHCNKEENLDAHHFDYSKPLEVVWLCRQCHIDLHADKLKIIGRR